MTGLYSISSPLARPAGFSLPEARPRGRQIRYSDQLNDNHNAVPECFTQLSEQQSVAQDKVNDLVRSATRKRNDDDSRVVEGAIRRVAHDSEALEFVGTLATVMLQHYRSEAMLGQVYALDWHSARSGRLAIKHMIRDEAVFNVKDHRQPIRDALRWLADQLVSAYSDGASPATRDYSACVAAGALRFMIDTGTIWSRGSPSGWSVARSADTWKLAAEEVSEPSARMLGYLAKTLSPEFVLPRIDGRPQPEWFRKAAGTRILRGESVSLDRHGYLVPADSHIPVGVAMQSGGPGDIVAVELDMGQSEAAYVTRGYFPETRIGDVQWRSGQDRPESDSEKLENVKIGGALRPGELADACRWLDGEARRQPDNPLARPN